MGHALVLSATLKRMALQVLVIPRAFPLKKKEMEEAILTVVLTRIMRTRLADCLIIISRSTKAPKVLQHTTAVPSKLTQAKGEKRHCNSRVQQSAGNNSFNLLAAAGATARDRRASSGPGARAMERNRALSLRRCTHGRRQHQSRGSMIFGSI